MSYVIAMALLIALITFEFFNRGGRVTIETIEAASVGLLLGLLLHLWAKARQPPKAK